MTDGQQIPIVLNMEDTILLQFVENDGFEIGRSAINFLCRKYEGDGKYDLQFKKLLYERPFSEQTCLDEKALTVKTISLPH